jgi:hypothetical protein
MSRELDILSKNDPKGADRLSQSCAELISLSRLLEDTSSVTNKIAVLSNKNKKISKIQEKNEISNDSSNDIGLISVSAGQLLGQSVTTNIENSRSERFQKLQKHRQSDGHAFYQDVATGVSQGNIGNTIDSSNFLANENYTGEITSNFFISMGLKDRYKHLQKEIAYEKGKDNTCLIMNKFRDMNNISITNDDNNNISINELIVDKNILQYNQDIIDCQSIKCKENNDIINNFEKEEEEEKIVWYL